MKLQDILLISWCALWTAMVAPQIWHVWCRWKFWVRTKGVVVPSADDRPAVLLTSGPHGQSRVPVHLIQGDDRQQFREGRVMEVAVDPQQARAGVPRSGRDFTILMAVALPPLILGVWSIKQFNPNWDASDVSASQSQSANDPSGTSGVAAGALPEASQLSRDRGERSQRERPSAPTTTTPEPVAPASNPEGRPASDLPLLDPTAPKTP